MRPRPSSRKKICDQSGCVRSSQYDRTNMYRRVLCIRLSNDLRWRMACFDKNIIYNISMHKQIYEICKYVRIPVAPGGILGDRGPPRKGF